MGPLSSPLHHFPSGLGPRPAVAQDTPVQTMSLLGMFGCQGHVVEHTEPTGSSPLAVVPRRSAGGNGHIRAVLCPLRATHRGGSLGRGQPSPHQGKPVVRGSCQHGIHQLQRSSRGQPGTVEGALWGQGCR